MEVQEGLQASVINVEHRLLTVQQQLQSVVEQLQQYNRNKSIFGKGLTTSLEKSLTSRVVVHNSFRLEGSNISRQEHHSQQNTETYSALNKMEFPYFDGENARGWVRRCTRFICFYVIKRQENMIELSKMSLQLKVLAIFVDEKVSSTLGCKLEKTTPTIVRVADGLMRIPKYLSYVSNMKYDDDFKEPSSLPPETNLSMGSSYYLKEGVSTDPQKIECMVNWTTPTTIKVLRGFLGLTWYYRKFIRSYGAISKPLTSLLKKDALRWNFEANTLWNQLKEMMVKELVLA
ncbi:putative mitochondrial protein [Sesamum angolense]|uniref:Mitochondrial protein n=1 Tax=Sesamum angolense TaxID=2727404 RepID=A0AAE1WBV9_9LAMI|nr:putative mitochondrial protein [Sesamum angolense]